MQSKSPESKHPARLVPLLRSIGHEILERAAAVTELDARIATLSSRAHSEEIARHRADASEHKRELRFAHRELERLGCAVDGLDPLTFRISVDDDIGFLWAMGSHELSPSLP
jgi:uncharacterized small protein (DUF1192 family)